MSEATRIALRSAAAWVVLASLIASAGLRISVADTSQQDIWLAAAFCGTR